MKNLLILFVLIISGCSQETKPWELQKAVNFCEGVEKISAISINRGIFMYSTVTCISGKTTFLQQEKV